MSAAAVLARKEIRAQSALWLGIVAAILAGGLASHDARDLEVMFYVIGALALGAASMGHEYRYGTLSHLLVQPIRRTTILMVKFGVLAGLLLALAAVGAALVFPQPRWAGSARDAFVALAFLPLLYGLVVAPWLTLKTHSTLAGTLFSGSLASLIFITGDRIGAARFESPAEIDAFRMTVLWIGSWLLVAGAAVALWRSFHGLEAADGVHSHIAIPAALRSAPAVASRRRHAFVRLVGKELRLQPLAFVASLFYCGLYLTLWARRASLPRVEDSIAVATGIHAMVVGALVGALSCAEERALGTLEWQLLQPISARAQFAVKVAVTASLTLLLALGLPAILWRALGGPHPWQSDNTGHAALLLVLLLSGSMYLSTVAGNALTAFFACVPAFMVGFWFQQNVAGRIAFPVFALFHGLPQGPIAPGLHRVPAGLAALVWGVFVLLVLAFAFENHRDADRSLRRAGVQLLELAALLAVTVAGFAAAGQFLW
jgi:hypothetical protein